MTKAQYEKATPVEIVRNTDLTGFRAVVLHYAVWLLRAYFIMIGISILDPQLHLSYWHALVVVVVAGALFQTDNYALWTRKQRKIGEGS